MSEHFGFDFSPEMIESIIDEYASSDGVSL